MQDVAQIDCGDIATHVSFSPSATLLASCSRDRRVVVTELSSGRQIHCFQHDAEPKCAEFSPGTDGLLATATADGMLRVFDISSGAALQRGRKHTAAVNDLCFSPNGAKVASASSDKTVNVMVVEGLTTVLRLTAHKGVVSAVQFSPCGRTLATASRDATCRIFDAESGSPVCVITHPSRVVCCAFAPSGACIATCAADGGVRIFCTGNSPGKKLFDVFTDASPSKRPVLACAFDFSGGLLATAGESGTCIYSLKMERQVAQCKRHREAVSCVRFSPGPDPTMLATASADRRVLVRSCNADSMVKVPSRRAQGLHLLLHLQDSDSVAEKHYHSVLSTKSVLYEQLRSIVGDEQAGLGSQSLRLPFEDHEIADVVLGPSHAAFMLVDGRVCRVGLGMEEKAVQQQVERAEALAASSRGRGSADVRARGHLQPSLRRRHRYTAQSERSAQIELAAASRRTAISRDPSETQRQQLRDELWEQHRERERDRPTRSRATGRGSSFALQGGPARVPQPAAFSYHHAAASLEMRAVASLGAARSRSGAAVNPPESMVQAVQEMFGSIPRDVIVRDLRATGSMEATIDRLLSRNSSSSSDRDGSQSSPSPTFDGSVLAALSRSATEIDSPSTSLPLGSTFRAATNRTAPGSQHQRPTTAPTSRSGSASAESLYSSLLSASGGGPVAAGTAAERDTTPNLPTFVASEIEWWDVALRFKSIAAMQSDLLAIGTDGKLYSWGWDENCDMNDNQPSEHRAKDLLHGECIRLLAACSTHAVVTTATGKIASWLDRCFTSGFLAGLPNSAFSALEHSATTLAPFDSDPVAMLDVSNFVTCAVTASGKVFWWGLKSPSHRKQWKTVAKESRHNKSATTIQAGCHVVLKKRPHFEAGALACYVSGGVASLCELVRDVVNPDEKKEHDFRILSWDLDHKAQSKGRPATKKLGLSDVIFLGGSAHESVGEVLKVDGTVAAVDFTNRCEHRSSPGVDVPTIALLQRCRLLPLADLRQALPESAKSEDIQPETTVVEETPQRVHIGVANCAPFACTITEHTVSLLLRQGDGQIFSYVADIAAQKYSARRIQAASPLSVHHPASKSKTRFVSGLHSSCILLQDSEGALFPPRGLPQIKCASVSQRALPYFDYSQSRPRKCNIVAVVFANSQLHTAVATGDLEMVQTLIAKHGLLYFDDGQNIFHLCAIAAPCKVEKVLHFLLGCKHLQGSLDSLLSARDGNGHVPFVTAIISNNLRIAEILLAKVDLLEPQRSSSLWGEDDNTLHAKALCAADSLGCTALHHLCAGVGARLDENIPIFRRACYSGDIVVKIKLMDTLLQTTNLGTAQDRCGNTALARLLMSKAPSELAVKLAQNTDVVNCSVAGSSQNPLSSDQLDRLVFCIFTLYHNDGADHPVLETMVQTLCADSLSGYSNATKLFVQSAVRVFCAVCATGTAKLADLEAAPVCSQIEHSSRSLFHMLPVLAISAVAEAADIIASPIRLGMVNPLSGLSPPFQAPLGEYELSRDVFSVYRSQPQEESIVGELGTAAKVGDEVNDAGSDGEVANTEEERSLNSMDLEGSASATLPSIDEEDAEEGDSEEVSDAGSDGDGEVGTEEERALTSIDPDEDAEDDEADDANDVDDEDHEQRMDASRQAEIDAAIIGGDFLSAVQHTDADISQEDMLDSAPSLNSRRAKEKAAAAGQIGAASLYACAFGRLVRLLVSFHELLEDDGPESSHDGREEMRKATLASQNVLQRTWDWLYVVMDCAESQLRASHAPQNSAEEPAERRGTAAFQNALLGLLRAQSTEPDPFSSANICQYRPVAYIADSYLHFISHPIPTDRAKFTDCAAGSFFQRTPSTTPYGGTRPVNFRASIKRGLPLAERPHILTPRASKRAMFGDGGDGDCSEERPRKRPSTYTSFASLVGAATSHSSADSNRSDPEAATLERWEATLRRLADAFLEDVGAEKHSSLARMAGFRAKQKLFRQRAAALCAASSVNLTIEVRRSTLLRDLFAALDKEFDRHRSTPIPLACRQVLAVFKGEKGEGDGVTRGLLAAASSKLASLVASERELNEPDPLFVAPGKDPGFFAPFPLHEFSQYRIGCFANVGRLVGLSLLHNLPISLAFTRPTIKFLLGREVNWTDLAFHCPDLYESLRLLLLTKNSAEFEAIVGCDLAFEVTEAPQTPGGKCVVVELRPGGKEQAVTHENIKEYVMLYAAHRMVKSVRPALEAMRRGLLQVLSETALAGLTAEDFTLLLNGCGPRVEIRWLKGITAFRDARTEQSRTAGRPLATFERNFWAAVTSMTDAERRELLYFSTGSPVHPHDFGGRRLTVHVKSDTSMLPNAQVCTLEMNVPFYHDQTVLKNKLLTSFKCVTYDYV